jgi:predicted PurR-regulated permease PerM
VSARNVLVWIAVVVVALVWVLRDLVLLVGYSVLLAYALLPVVAAIQRPLGRRGPQVPRGAAAAVVMLGLVAIVGWLLALAVPRLAAQATRFASGAPDAVVRAVQGLSTYGAAHGLSSWLDPVIVDVRANLSPLLQNLVGTLAGWAGLGLGGLGQVLALALLPLLAFYLLAESAAVQVSALRFVPEGAHSEIARLGGAIDRALRSYVRGQAIVCLVMGIVVGVALALLGSPVALLLGLLVGFAELVPYLGFLVAAVAIALAGLSVSPLHALVGVAAYTVINWVIGTFVTPRVMGRYLKMHPFIVTVSVLAGTQIFGPAGALLALPGAAMIQAVVGELAPTRRAARS